MNTQNTLNKISTEISEKLFAYLEMPETKDFLAKMKDAGDDSGRFEVIISTADQDRQGEIVSQEGWDLNHYKNNPVVLWGHNYTGLPIGVTDSIEVKDGKLVAKGRFAPESANPFAQQVRRLYDAKILRTTSVGFIAKEMEGNTITKAELLEFSFVPVPANPMALSLMKDASFDSGALVQKGLVLEVKAKEQAGDVCQLDDGGEGVLEEDGEGNLVCRPKPEPEDTEEDDEEKGMKDGRVLSAKSKTQIVTAITGIKAALVALEELLKAVDLGGEDEAGDEAGQRSNTSEEARKGFKEWDHERQFLRVINNITSDALRKINERHDS
jgi:HK97 family phage prohead protease